MVFRRILYFGWLYTMRSIFIWCKINTLSCNFRFLPFVLCHTNIYCVHLFFFFSFVSGPEIIQHNSSCQNHNRCLIVWSALNLPYINGILIVIVVWLLRISIWWCIFNVQTHTNEWHKIKTEGKKEMEAIFCARRLYTCIFGLDWQYKLCYVDDIINYNMNWFLIFVLLLSSSNTNSLYGHPHIWRTPYFHFLLLVVVFIFF